MSLVMDLEVPSGAEQYDFLGIMEHQNQSQCEIALTTIVSMFPTEVNGDWDSYDREIQNLVQVFTDECSQNGFNSLPTRESIFALYDHTPDVSPEFEDRTDVSAAIMLPHTTSMIIPLSESQNGLPEVRNFMGHADKGITFEMGFVDKDSLSETHVLVTLNPNGTYDIEGDDHNDVDAGIYTIIVNGKEQKFFSVSKKGGHSENNLKMYFINDQPIVFPADIAFGFFTDKDTIQAGIDAVKERYNQ